METGGLSPAAWTRVTVKAAETMRYEVATRPPETRPPPNNNVTPRVNETNAVRFDPGAIALSASEQTQTTQAVARRKQANLKPLPKEGEDDELPGSRGRRGAARGGAASRSARSFAMDADGNLFSFGGDGDGAALGEGASEEPLFQSPSQKAAEAGEEGEMNLRASSSHQAMAGLAGASEWESHLLTREQRQRGHAMRSGYMQGTVAMDDPALLVQGQMPGADAGSPAGRPAAPTLFPPAQDSRADPYFVRQQIGAESMFHPDAEEASSLFETPDGQSIYRPGERDSIFEVGDVEPIFDPPELDTAEAVSSLDDESQMQVEKEVMLAMENQVLEPVRKLEPALLATMASDRYR